MNVQIIHTPAGDDLVVMSRAEYERLCAAAGMDPDADEANRLLASVRSGAEEIVPAEVVNRLLAGENPIKVWREHRRLTQEQLATEAGINPVYLSQLERKVRRGSVDCLQSLARALRVDLDDLVGESGEE